MRRASIAAETYRDLVARGRARQDEHEAHCDGSSLSWVRARVRGLGAPRERHTFASVLSANRVPVENITLLARRDRTATIESVYRHEIRPALTQGAEVMDKIFG